MLRFTNQDHSLRPFRLSDNEAEIAQLLKDGWFPINADETAIVVSRNVYGTYLLDGRTIHDTLNPLTPELFLDRLANLFTDEEWDYMTDSRKGHP